MADAILFEDSFQCTALDHQKYDRVGRITATSSDSTIHMTLDLQVEIYPFSAGDSFQIALASTLNTDGTKDDGKAWRDVQKNEPTLADHYDYVMYGKTYRTEEGKGENIKVFTSFGGLLLYMEGPYKRLTTLRSDNMYLLMRKS